MCKIICDNCQNFEVSMDNTKQMCHAKKDGSQVLPSITDDYIAERFEGIKKTCKSFKRINQTKTK